MSFPKSRPARRMSGLQRWIDEKARADGDDPARLRRAVSYMVVADVLARLGGEEGILFILKGGVAMMMRLGPRARFSTDLDVSYVGEGRELEALLAGAPDHPVGPFSAAPVGAPERIGETGALRFRMRLSYGHETWGTIDLEAGTPTDGSVDPAHVEWLEPRPNLAIFGIDGRPVIPCMSVAYQIAQKLHACTEWFEGRENQRSQDLVDLQLLEALVERDGWREVRRACEDVFVRRAKHAWPPHVTLHAGWSEEYAEEARKSGFPVADAEMACQIVNLMVERIANA